MCWRSLTFVVHKVGGGGMCNFGKLRTIFFNLQRLPSAILSSYFYPAMYKLHCQSIVNNKSPTTTQFSPKYLLLLLTNKKMNFSIIKENGSKCIKVNQIFKSPTLLPFLALIISSKPEKVQIVMSTLCLDISTDQSHT